MHKKYWEMGGIEFEHDQVLHRYCIAYCSKIKLTLSDNVQLSNGVDGQVRQKLV